MPAWRSAAAATSATAVGSSRSIGIDGPGEKLPLAGLADLAAKRFEFARGSAQFEPVGVGLVQSALHFGGGDGHAASLPLCRGGVKVRWRDRRTACLGLRAGWQYRERIGLSGRAIAKS